MSSFRRTKNESKSSKPPGLPIPPQFAAILRESWWLAAVVGSVYLVVILASYSPADPGWSHAATQAVVRNKGGSFGAWLSDVMLSMFGLSAWWWVVFCVAAILWGYRRLEQVQENRRIVVIAVFGYLLLLASSCSLEYLRLHGLGLALPDRPGGILGFALGGRVAQVLGFSGATLILLACFGIGLSVFSGVSWLAVMEQLGGAIEDTFLRIVNAYQASQDRRAGEIAAHKREAKVSEERQKFDDAPRVIIDEGPLEVAKAPAAIKAEEKARIKAAQPSLFEDDELPPWSEPQPAPEVQKPVAPPRPAEPAKAPEVARPPAPVRPPEPIQHAEPVMRAPEPARPAAPEAPAVAPAPRPQPVYQAPAQPEPAPYLTVEDELTVDVDPEQYDCEEWADTEQVPLFAAERILAPEPVSSALTRPAESTFKTPQPAVPPPQPVPQPAPPRVAEPQQAALLQPAPPLQQTPPPPPAEPVIRKAPELIMSGRAELPSITLLAPPSPVQELVSHETIEYTSRLIERKLAEFNVEVRVVAAYPGPVITRYEVEPAVGVKGSQIVNLMKDLARALSLVSIRVVETIPGKTCMGLELPNPRRQIVRLSEIIGSQPYHDAASLLTMAMGKDISGKPVVTDLAKAPHMLVAGTTGSGKSVAMNAIILSILYKATAEEVRLIMVDPKMLELSVYADIPHLLAPVVTDMKHAANALNWCVSEMEKRYRLMSAMGVRNLAGFNQKVKEAEKQGRKLTNPFSLTPDNPEPVTAMPLIVVLIDELADLMMVAGKKIEELIARLAQKARAAGIHLILATQRPSVDVITGLIKANIPTRCAFQVSSKIDSRTILDQMGAESLLGQGDGLFLPPGSGYPQRIHGAFVADEEVHAVVEFLKTQGEPDYIEGILTGQVEGMEGAGEFSLTSDGEGDDMYDQAVQFVIKSRKASISSVQRQLRIGYNRAARLIEQMEQAGLVSPAEHNGNRTVLVPAREE